MKPGKTKEKSKRKTKEDNIVFGGGEPVFPLSKVHSFDKDKFLELAKDVNYKMAILYLMDESNKDFTYLLNNCNHTFIELRDIGYLLEDSKERIIYFLFVINKLSDFLDNIRRGYKRLKYIEGEKIDIEAYRRVEYVWVTDGKIKRRADRYIYIYPFKIEEAIKKFKNEISILEKYISQQTENISKDKSEISKKKKLKNKYDTFIKYFFNVAESCEDVPTLEDLTTGELKQSSVGRWLLDENIVLLLIKKCESKLNRKNLSKKNKELYNKLRDWLIDRKIQIQNKEKKKIRTTKKIKPDHNEKIGNKVKINKKANIDLYERYYAKHPDKDVQREFAEQQNDWGEKEIFPD